jgi:hypothetical protein
MRERGFVINNEEDKQSREYQKQFENGELKPGAKN